MNDFAFGRRGSLGIFAVASLCGLAFCGCSEATSQGPAAGDLRGATIPPAAHASVPHEPIAAPETETPSTENFPGEVAPGVERSTAEPVSLTADTTPTENASPSPVTTSPPAQREFVVEGDALRVGFDDLDLLKVLRMDPVTPDCVDKMPAWLRGLDGKTVRIRGFMKPGLLLEGIPQFMFVRDTGLCCFGPKGKIYDMIAVTLKEGTTTNYIELKPFDVVGKFRIELLQLEDDGTIFGLYYIDDARIIPK